MKIGIDVDGVLGDIVKHTQAHLGLEPADPSQYDIAKYFNVDRYTISSIWHKPGFCESMPLVDGAREAISRLSDNELFFITAPAPSPTWAWERRQWLRAFFNASDEQIILCSAKYMIDVDMLIDDNPAMLEQWSKRYDARVALLFDASYNKGQNFVRLLGWDDPFLGRLVGNE